MVQVICFRGLLLNNEEEGGGFEGCTSWRRAASFSNPPAPTLQTRCARAAVSQRARDQLGGCGGGGWRSPKHLAPGESRRSPLPSSAPAGGGTAGTSVPSQPLGPPWVRAGPRPASWAPWGGAGSPPHSLPDLCVPSRIPEPSEPRPLTSNRFLRGRSRRPLEPRVPSP